MHRDAAIPVGYDDSILAAVATAALEFVSEGSCIGLGSGRAAAAFIARLGIRVRQGLHVSGVPASEMSARLAREAGVPLIELTEHVELDLMVDGADEVTPDLDLIKGRGGALVRERIIAAASRRQVILVGNEKLVSALGGRHPIPVEIIPFAAESGIRQMKAIGLVPAVRMDASQSHPWISENGNLTIDCSVREPIADGTAARSLEAALLAIAGVVDTGLFLGTAERVLVGYPDQRVNTLKRRGESYADA